MSAVDTDPPLCRRPGRQSGCLHCPGRSLTVRRRQARIGPVVSRQRERHASRLPGPHQTMPPPTPGRSWSRIAVPRRSPPGPSRGSQRRQTGRSRPHRSCRRSAVRSSRQPSPSQLFPPNRRSRAIVGKVDLAANVGRGRRHVAVAVRHRHNRTDLAGQVDLARSDRSASVLCSDTYCATLTVPVVASIAIANAAISAVDTNPSLLLSTRPTIRLPSFSR